MNIIEVNDTEVEPVDKQFIDEMKNLLKLFYEIPITIKNEKITTCIKILNIIDKYSFIFNITKYNNFVSILKNKLT